MRVGNVKKANQGREENNTAWGNEQVRAADTQAEIPGYPLRNHRRRASGPCHEGLRRLCLLPTIFCPPSVEGCAVSWSSKLPGCWRNQRHRENVRCQGWEDAVCGGGWQWIQGGSCGVGHLLQRSNCYNERADSYMWVLPTMHGTEWALCTLSSSSLV